MLPPERFLIVQLADIGDLIVSTPALAALREAKPDAHITLLTSSHGAPALDGTRLVDEIITFDRQQFNNSSALLKPSNLRRLWSLRKGRYDTILFFHHFTLKLGTLKFALIGWRSGAKRRIGLDNGNGWFLTDSLPDGGFGAKHQAQYWLDLVGLVGADASPHSAVVGIDREDSLVGLPYKHPRIVIHAGSGGYSRARRWDAERFAQVADRLHDHLDAQIVLVGTPGDDGEKVKAVMKSEPVDLIGKTTLRQLAGVIRQSDLFIGADSGVMHIAEAAGTPIVAVFGPSNHEAWGPWGVKSIIVRSAPECSPCSYVEHSVGLREGCPARTCMRMVTVESVLKAATSLLTDNFVGERPRPSQTASREFDERIHILDFPVDAITYEQWLEMIGEWVKERDGTCHHVCTINPEFIMIARSDINFANILKRADLCVPDGVGLLWAARRLGKPLPERVTGSDGVPRIAERAAREGWRLFFLGAAPGVADKAASILRETHPGLQIVGTYAGSPAPEDEDTIVERVNASGADILFVAYGAPNQDKWIARNLPRLKVKMAMGVGGAFDFIAGVLPRAPLWMQDVGLEWLFRLYLQPSRVGRMMRLPRFVLAFLLSRK